MKLIRSRDNPRFKALRELATSTRERRKAGLALLDGAHLISAYRASGGVPEQLILSDSAAAKPEAAQLAAGASGLGVLVLADSLFNDLAQVVTPTGIVALIRTPKPGPLPSRIERCVMLENIQDAGNLGSILRSTAAAGIRTVLLSRGCAFAWSPKVLRAGMGAHFSLDIFDNADLAAAVPRLSGRLICASGHARKSLYQADLRGPLAWVFGNEGSGVSAELSAAAAEQLRIPMPGKAESLNVAAAAAICLFEQVRQRG
ncbi:MAG: RNA methyltransferase [Betaproteobacteria bacterium]|nr:RNA methyltransferase [Betaproteobacteria bacterium]